MVNRCAVDDCMSRYPHCPPSNIQKQKLSVFRVPKSPSRRRLWSDILKCSKPLGIKDYICELHFYPADVIKEDVIKLKDGTYNVIKRDRNALKSTALPINIQKDIKVEDPEIETENYEDGENSQAEYLNVDDTGNLQRDLEEYMYTYANIVDDIKSISLESWAWINHDEYIKYIWIEKLNLMPKLFLTIHKNKKVTMSFLDAHVEMEIQANLSCKQDIVKVLQQVEHFHYCPGTGVEAKKRAFDCVLIQDRRCNACKLVRQILQKKKSYESNFKEDEDINLTSKIKPNMPGQKLLQKKNTIFCIQNTS
ncbi:uncharacterized protein [Prorops nasuta]|uniref:uncharacterized protein isoform X2 n=2 Tax=Prorops nasuta TaxID=863751 RepID=UPI0034CDFB56